MILIIMFLIILILGIVFLIISNHFGVDIMDTFGGIFTIFGFLSLVIALVTIILSHGMTDKMIQQNRLEYDGLCKRYEIIKSEYEDVSKSDVIADITAWNKKVYNTKYWTDNLWTNWFNPKALADDLKYISLEEK